MRAARFKRSVGAAAGLTALALAAVACGSGGSQSSGSSSKPIGTFTYAINTAPNTLSGWSTAGPDDEIAPLVTQVMGQVPVSGPVTPVLYTAEKYATPTSIVYTLRKGVKFSDGSTMTASDVAWSINEAIKPTNTESANLQSIKSAAVTGPDQVTVTLSVPNPVANLQVDGVSIQEEKFGAAHLKNLGTPTALPIGTGPYKYQSETADAITLVENPYYKGKRPAPRTLVFSVISTDTSVQLAMKAGSVQAYELTNLKQAPSWRSQAGATISAVTPECSDMVSMDTLVAPFNNIHVREAVAYSINRTGLMQAGFAGYATPLQAIVPATELENNAPSLAAAQKFEASLPTWNYDLTKAKQQLAESPYPHGFSATIPYINNSTWEQLFALNLQQAMKPLGVKLTPKPEPSGEWFAAAFGSHSATGIQLLTTFCTTGPGGPNDGLLYGMLSKATERPGYPDLANFSNPTVEQYYPAIAITSFFKYTQAQRWTATQVLLRQIATQVPYVPLWSEQDVFALAPGYKLTKTPTLDDQTDGAWVNFIARS